jgi:hypothetical protein
LSWKPVIQPSHQAWPQRRMVMVASYLVWMSQPAADFAFGLAFMCSASHCHLLPTISLLCLAGWRNAYVLELSGSWMWGKSTKDMNDYFTSLWIMLPIPCDQAYFLDGGRPVAVASFFFSFFFFFDRTGMWTLGLTLARQVLYRVASFILGLQRHLQYSTGT